MKNDAVILLLITALTVVVMVAANGLEATIGKVSSDMFHASGAFTLRGLVLVTSTGTVLLGKLYRWLR